VSTIGRSLAGAALVAPLLLSACGAGSAGPSGNERAASSAPLAPVPGASPTGSYLAASGSGPQTTQAFEAPGAWDVDYTYDCSATGGDFQLYVAQAGRVLNVLADVPDRPRATGASTTRWPSGGTYMLVIKSPCDWTVQVGP
jgi:hypothetical protein